MIGSLSSAPSQDPVDGDLESVLSQIWGAPAVFRLLPLPGGAQHKLGWIVGRSSGFLELVVIDSDEVVLIGAHDD